MNTEYDEDGNKKYFDDDGNELIPVRTNKIVEESSGWKIYDSSMGHCCFCGMLGCNGRCCQPGY